MGQKVVPYAYGNPIWVYAYGPSHTRMGQYTHTGQNIDTFVYNNVTQLKPAVLAVEAYYLTHLASQ